MAKKVEKLEDAAIITKYEEIIQKKKDKHYLHRIPTT